LPGRISLNFTKFLQSRDELSFRNIRIGLWPAVLVFPLSVIVGNLRYYDHSVALAGFESDALMFFLLGLGWLILTFTPKQFIIQFLRLAAVVSAAMILFLIFMPMGFGQFAIYMTIKFFNGLSAACAFYLFCFVVNLPHDSWVILNGNIVGQLPEGRHNYSFRDSSGEITVDIGPKEWRGLSAGVSDRVEIYGEVKIHRGQALIKVHAIRLI